MVDAYLQWMDLPAAPPTPAPEEAPQPSEYDFNIECVDFYSLADEVLIRRSSHESPAEGLVRNGYLGVSPDRPTLAVSIKTLELFYDIRRVKVSFSVEAFTKLVCHKYIVSSRGSVFGDMLMSFCRYHTTGDLRYL